MTKWLNICISHAYIIYKWNVKQAIHSDFWWNVCVLVLVAHIHLKRYSREFEYYHICKTIVWLMYNVWPVAINSVVNVTSITRAEKGLVVVHGQLGQAGDHLLHALLLIHVVTWCPSSCTHQSGLLQVVLQFWPIIVINFQWR